jgi:uncharacterized protein YqgC (DUF456 family)
MGSFRESSPTSQVGQFGDVGGLIAQRGGGLIPWRAPALITCFSLRGDTMANQKKQDETARIAGAATGGAVGAGIGAAIGGPVGAAIGAIIASVIGHWAGKELQGKKRGN